MKMTESTISLGTGASASVAAAWLAPLQAACDKFAINTTKRVAAFLVNVGVESGGLTKLVENMNYSAERLAVVWPGRFALDPKAKPPVPTVFARSIAGDHRKIANVVYANRLGNGDTDSGDGFLYRGQGPIQLTGRDNVLACGKAIGVDLIAHPELLQTPDVGSMSAAWFFSMCGCNELADADNISKVVEKINGKAPCPENQGSIRIARYNATVSALASVV